MLGVKTIVYLTPDVFEGMDKEFNCIHIEVKNFGPELEVISLSDITNKVGEAIKNKQGPVFLFCINGFLSSAVACEYVMRTNKAFSKEIAMAYIMNKRYENKDMPAWLYSMIAL